MGPPPGKEGGPGGKGAVVRVAERKAGAPGEAGARRGISAERGNSALAKRPPEPGQQMVPSRLELMLAEAARSFQLTERAKAESKWARPSLLLFLVLRAFATLGHSRC